MNLVFICIISYILTAEVFFSYINYNTFVSAKCNYKIHTRSNPHTKQRKENTIIFLIISCIIIEVEPKDVEP
ncbi:hypothetical protein M2451_001650 [Dysgonomonas sp. PFB1-18]|nr:hypothetical protein [Dysgonomonas sp. PF1-14]MDH6338643.1 hypothetical protein [Dysgonomonas sp. PF1-16]MDH6380329.1 hypothetical protein [Dysgonomonas sp. PFB1-18]MDH6397659.1 hypothetical protein [Dysgonomonas sp. PF1-23]